MVVRVAIGGLSQGRGVGRANELASGTFACGAARNGMGSVLAVVGAAGSGKTWLCEALVESASDDGFRVGWGSGWPGGGVPALWPWRQAVGPSAGLLDGAPDVAGAGWFEWCAGVVDGLRELTADRPTLLVIDDADQADPPSLALARFVARQVRGLRLVLVVAHTACEHGHLADLRREATTLALHGLGRDDAAALLSDRGLGPLTAADLAFVVDTTGGLPGALHRLANQAGDPADVVATLVAERMSALPGGLRHAAARAAVIDDAPPLGEVAAVAGLAGADLDELERQRVAARRSPDRLTFGHPRIRSALIATLTADEVIDVHVRMAALLADGPPSLDRLPRRAEHALAAADVDPEVAIAAALDAADALVAGNQPQRAAALLTAAEEVHHAALHGSPPAALLAALAGALLRCGRLAAAREQARRAASAAEKEGDAVSLARAALGLGGVWLAEERSPIDRERYLDLLRRARFELPAGEVALRLRLDVRRAAEAAYETGEFAEIEAQVAAARAHGDPTLLSEALSLYHHAMLGPDHRDERAAVADEMLSAAARADDNFATLMALLWLTVDQFLDGSPQAVRSLGELHERTAALGGCHLAYIASVMDVMLLQRAGRLTEAERAAETAFTVGMEVGDADAVAYYGGQLVTLRWIQGRAAEVLGIAAEVEASPTITPLNEAFTATLASLAAETGDHDRARALLSRLQGRLHTIHQSSAWLITLYAVVEAAHVLGDAEITGEAAALLEPYAELPVLGSLGVSCLGSVRRSLGLAAVTAGDLDRGIAQLEQAVAHDVRLGNRPLAAMTAVSLAQARAARGRGDDARAAAALLDHAISGAEAMDLPVRAEEWRALRAAVAAPRPDVARSADLAGPAASASRRDLTDVGIIERRGRSWVLDVAGRQVLVPELQGMTYLVQLLMNPGVEIAAAELVASGEGSAALAAVRPEQPLMDEAALAAYRRRVAELEDELAEAESYADPERAARVRIELDALVDELARGTNHVGRSRTFTSSNERARTAVQKAVRRTLDHIEGVDPTLGTTLRQSVHTGRTCCYDPVPAAPRRWSLAA